MTQYVYATTIFEIKCRAMADAMTSFGSSGRKRNQAEIIREGALEDGLPDALLERASAILEWYLKDLPKTTLGDMPDYKL